MTSGVTFVDENRTMLKSGNLYSSLHLMSQVENDGYEVTLEKIPIATD